MKIEIYDPAMCCPTGVCGPAVDPKLVRLQETLRLLEQQCGAAVSISRFGLSSDPRAFVDNLEVGRLLKEQGPECLPLTFVNGELVASGAYLAPEEFQSALAAQGIQVDLAVKTKKPSCCGPGCC